jgi:hypothetical protein
MTSETSICDPSRSGALPNRSFENVRLNLDANREPSIFFVAFWSDRAFGPPVLSGLSAIRKRYRSLSLACATTTSHPRHLHREVVYVFSCLWNGIILCKARRNRLPSLLLFRASSDDVAITGRLAWLVPATE